MACNNMTTQIVPKGWDYVERPIKCGNTRIDGSRAICDQCANDSRKMAEIERQERNIEADNAWARSAGYGEY